MSASSPINVEIYFHFINEMASNSFKVSENNNLHYNLEVALNLNFFY